MCQAHIGCVPRRETRADPAAATEFPEPFRGATIFHRQLQQFLEESNPDIPEMSAHRPNSRRPMRLPFRSWCERQLRVTLVDCHTVKLPLAGSKLKGPFPASMWLNSLRLRNGERSVEVHCVELLSLCSFDCQSEPSWHSSIWLGRDTATDGQVAAHGSSVARQSSLTTKLAGNGRSTRWRAWWPRKVLPTA